MKKLVLAAVLVASPAIAEKPVSTKIKIDGSTYYVRHRVVEKTAAVVLLGFKVSTATRWINAKVAAEQVTGCKVKDSFSRDATLYVSLDCPATG